MAPVSALMNKGKRKYINKDEAVKVMHTSAGEPIGCLQPCLQTLAFAPFFFPKMPAQLLIGVNKEQACPRFDALVRHRSKTFVQRNFDLRYSVHHRKRGGRCG